METKWGSQSDSVQMQLNVEQANFARDALAKAIHTRIFDFLVAVRIYNHNSCLYLFFLNFFLISSTVLDYPAFLFGVDKKYLGSKMISRQMETKWGGQSDSVQVTLNTQQAAYARDALSKAIHARIFDYLVQVF